MSPWYVLVVNGAVNRDYESDDLRDIEIWTAELEAKGYSVEVVKEYY